MTPDLTTMLQGWLNGREDADEERLRKHFDSLTPQMRLAIQSGYSKERDYLSANVGYCPDKNLIQRALATYDRFIGIITEAVEEHKDRYMISEVEVA